jgi:hypothetical protein
MNPQLQQAVGPMMEHTIMQDMSFRVLDQCWDTCYDKRLERADLSKSLVPEKELKAMGKCRAKCVARNFEVMALVNKSREQREREAAMGLPPGALNDA